MCADLSHFLDWAEGGSGSGVGLAQRLGRVMRLRRRGLCRRGARLECVGRTGGAALARPGGVRAWGARGRDGRGGFCLGGRGLRRYGQRAGAPGGEQGIERGGEATQVQPQQNQSAGIPRAFGDSTFQFGEEASKSVHGCVI